MPLHPPPTPDGRPLAVQTTRLQEAQPNRLPQGASPAGPPVPELLTSSQDSTRQDRGHPLLQVGTPQARAYQDSSPLALGLRDSSPPCQGRGTPPGEPRQDSFPHLTTRDSSLPHQAGLRGLSPICLTHHPGVGCMGQVALELSRLAHPQASRVEASPQCLQGHGDRPAVASLPSLVASLHSLVVLGLTGRAPWVPTEDLALPEACW